MRRVLVCIIPGTTARVSCLWRNHTGCTLRESWDIIRSGLPVAIPREHDSRDFRRALRQAGATVIQEEQP